MQEVSLKLRIASTFATGLLCIFAWGVANAQTAAPVVQGAPLDAPVDPKGEENDGPGGLQDAKPLGRALPQESLDLLKSAEGSSGQAKGFQRTKDGKYIKVTFGAIGEFPYEVPDPDAVLASPDPKKAPKDQIPASVKALDKKKAVVVGFMVPIEVEGDGDSVQVKSFALTQNQMFCCFGVPPAMNQWVMVTMEGAPSKYYADLPIAVYGDFEVGEDIEDGYVMSVYRMRAEKTMDVRELLKQAQADSE
ncbi:MAG: DUF3299 domain-containing protein [Candidatus Hydrogenedentes bacterium]|nr:DUF3299 domain-containing protein [Candidatus Hydrogenedentota bacterium]